MKKKKMDKWVLHELNESHKRNCFEISSALLLRPGGRNCAAQERALQIILDHAYKSSKRNII